MFKLGLEASRMFLIYQERKYSVLMESGYVYSWLVVKFLGLLMLLQPVFWTDCLSIFCNKSTSFIKKEEDWCNCFSFLQWQIPQGIADSYE